MPTWLARMNATSTVSPDPVNAKSSMVARPVARVCTAPADPRRPNGMRSSVARSVLLTQIAFPCTLMPLTPTKPVRLNAGPLAHTTGRPPLAGTRQINPSTESATYRNPERRSNATPFGTPLTGSAAIRTGRPPPLDPPDAVQRRAPSAVVDVQRPARGTRDTRHQGCPD